MNQTSGVGGAIADDLSAGFFAGFDIGTMVKFAENEQKIDSIFYRSLTRYITHLLHPRTSFPRILLIYDPLHRLCAIFDHAETLAPPPPSTRTPSDPMK